MKRNTQWILIQRTLFIWLLFFGVVYSQRLFTGTVSDSLAPLERANVLARPLTKKTGVIFTATDHKGRYRLELDKETDYRLSVSYLGYAPEEIEIRAAEPRSEHHFRLKMKGEKLSEVIVSYEMPIIVKKDTLIYKVDAFTLGSERKMKDILQKLPGVAVDEDGIVTVQGKQVTQMLVEGKLFFGGSSKLAVENVPADAIDKIEVIDHFNEVGFLKEVSSSDDLAMNVLLKEEKKKFVFGDLEAGIGAKESHLLHAALFYYSPTFNLSTIGDGNNFGKSAFGFQDLIHFQGGVSRFTNRERKPLTDLSEFAKDNHNMSQHKSDFAAINYGFSTKNNLHITGFGLFSKLFSRYEHRHLIEYLTNATSIFEQRQTNVEQRDVIGMANLKLDYSPTEKEKWFYNLHWDLSDNSSATLQTSASGEKTRFIETFLQADNFSLKQYVEWHKSHNEKNMTTFVANHIYQKATPKKYWKTDAFLEIPLLTLLTDNPYHISQVKQNQRNQLDVLFKHYWIIDGKNHLYFDIGSNANINQLTIKETQLPKGDKEGAVSIPDFGNELNYTLTDLFSGFVYRFRIEKIVSKLSLFSHYYSIGTHQSAHVKKAMFFAFQPAIESTYERNDTEKITFYYHRKNETPAADLFTENFTLNSYNSVFKGNPNLQHEIYDTFSLSHEKKSRFLSTSFFSDLNFSKVSKSIADEVIFEDINRFSTLFNSVKPQYNWNFSTQMERNVYKARVRLNYLFNQTEYYQKINTISSPNRRISQTFKADVRFSYAQGGIVSFSYAKGFNRFKGFSEVKLTTDYLLTTLDYKITPSLFAKAQYAYFKNKNQTHSQLLDFQIVNLYLSYQRKNSPLAISIILNNLLNTQTKVNSSVSNFLVAEQITHILPRTAVFSLCYEL